MQHYDIGLIPGHFYTGCRFASRQRKRMEKAIELFAAGHVSNIMTTGGNCAAGTKYYLIPHEIKLYSYLPIPQYER